MDPFQNFADTLKFQEKKKQLSCVCVLSNLQIEYFNVIFLVTESKSFLSEYIITVTYLSTHFNSISLSYFQNSMNIFKTKQ